MAIRRANGRPFISGHIVAQNGPGWADENIYTTNPTTIASTMQPGVSGTIIIHRWGTILTGSGPTYDFTLMDAQVSYMQANYPNRGIVFQISDRSFTDATPEQYIPQYLIDLGLSMHCDGAGAGYVSRRWHSTVQAALIATHVAIASRYASSPVFCGTATQETAIGISAAQIADFATYGYTAAIYRDALIAIGQGIASGSSSRLWFYMNYLQGGQSMLTTVCNTLAVSPYNVAIGGPDILPNDNSLVANVYPIYAQLPIGSLKFCAAQFDSFRHLKPDGVTYYTPTEISNYARTTLGVHALPWNNSRSTTPYKITDAYPVIASTAASFEEQFPIFSVVHGTTFDSRVYAPYVKAAIPAQSNAVGSVISLSAAFYIAGGTNPVWSATGLTALGLSINTSTGMITGSLSGVTGNFTVTCTNSVNFVTSASTQWAVTGTFGWSQNLPDPIQIPQGGFFSFAPYITGTPAGIADSVAEPSGVTIEALPIPGLRAAGNAPLTGGVSGHRFTLAATTAEADWNARIAGSGVQWYTAFPDRTNVDRYRWDQNHPDRDLNDDSNIWWEAGAGVIPGYGCVRISQGSEIPPGRIAHATGWCRPFSPFPGDPGYVAGMPAPDFANDQSLFNWTVGWYGHRDYWSSWPNRFLGDEFYLQFRYKPSSSRSSITTNAKNWRIAKCYDTPIQEIVQQSHSGYPNRNILNLYSDFGANHLNQPQQVGSSPDVTAFTNPPYPGAPFTTYKEQMGGLWDATCGYPNNNDPTKCFAYPADEWTTVLLHIKCGHFSNNPVPDLLSHTNCDTQIEVFVCTQSQINAGDATYKTVITKNDFLIFGETVYPQGWQAFQMDDRISDGGSGSFTQRYDQVIFSHNFIPCPQI